MKKIQYKKGQVVGNCVYLKELDTKLIGRKQRRVAVFMCNCGLSFEASIDHVKSKHTKSCGCAKGTHKLSSHPHYSIWEDIVQRCCNPKNKSYHNYGGRGINIYKEWKEDYKTFHDYIITLPNYNVDKIGRYGLTLDRIRNNEGYKPGNLRWTTRHYQNVNLRMQKRNKSGFIGVSFNKDYGKYESAISVNGKRTRFGYFDTAAEAVIPRNEFIIANGLNEYQIQ
jgi:hypothetical protein